LSAARRRPPSRGTILRRRLVAVAVLLAGGVALFALLSGDRPADSSTGGGKTLRLKLPPPEADQRRTVERALDRGVAAAAGMGGSVEAAAMLTSWEAPVVVASTPGGEDRWMRMWSLSKVVTAVAILRAKDWGEERGEELAPEVEEALQAAFARSENCPQRRLVLELQHSLGDSPQRAREALAEVLQVAGGEARPGQEVAAPDAACVEFLQSQSEIPEPLAPALLLGTSEWRVGDAARFMHALAGDAYGEAVSRKVLGLMREPKQMSREVLPGEFTAPLDWGAGRALARFGPAYKAGWGGTQQGGFLAGQMVLFEPGSGERAAVAVVFHPAEQPSIDDPGLTRAPEALEAVMDALAEELAGDQQPEPPR
jgi:hypothetical protein